MLDQDQNNGTEPLDRRQEIVLYEVFLSLGFKIWKKKELSETMAHVIVNNVPI
jgi:hypothetical protein